MEKETKVTAEEPTTNKVLEDNTWRVYGQTFCTLCDNGAKSAMIRPVVRQAMHEFADLKCAPLISQLELQENYNDMLVKELNALKQQADKMAEVLEKLSNCVNAYPSMKYEKSLIVEALTNYKQTKH